jgi:hypothetical protein
MRKNGALERLRFEHKILNAETVNPHEKTTLNKRLFKGIAKGLQRDCKGFAKGF